jgi:cell division protein FtsB
MIKGISFSVQIKEGDMAANCNEFTEEQIELLRQNPYVRKISATMISFTADFKRRFWEMYTKGNLMPREIFGLLGIDAKILGFARVRGIPYALKQEYVCFGDFSDVRRNAMNKEKFPPDQELKRLRMELEYLKQEHEFLKKIISAERGGNSK